MTAPWKVLAVTAFVVAAVAVLSTALIVHNLSGSISSLRQQVTAVQARDWAAMAQTRAVLAAAQARLSGGHRDLITCGDLAALLNGPPQVPYEGLNSILSNYTTATGISLALPAHCLNQ